MANSLLKRYHFQGNWKNGDRMVVCSYGKNKHEAFLNILRAKKDGKFVHRKNDDFHVRNVTEEEVFTNYRSKGYSKREANILAKYGHTTYIVKDGKVTIN